MITLIGFECRKRWESLKWPALGVIALAVVLAILAGFSARAGIGASGPRDAGPGGPWQRLFPLVSQAIWLYPLLDAGWRFFTDLGGRHAPLEAGFARPAWARVLAKVIVSYGLFLLSTWLVLAITALRSLIAGGRAEAAGGLEAWVPEPAGVAYLIAFGLVLFACIAAYHLLKYRTRWAAPLPIAVLVAYGWASGVVQNWFAWVVRGDEGMIERFVLLMSVLVMVAAFAAASRWVSRAEV